MIKLIRKDLLLHRKFALWMGILYPLYLGYFGSRINSLNLLAFFGGFLYTLVPLILFGRDDKFKAAPFNLSLPSTRREIMGSRYLLSWGMMILMSAAGSLLIVIMPGGKLKAAAVFAPRFVLVSLSLMAVSFSVLMPLFVRFGQVGLIVFAVALQILGIIAMLFRHVISVQTIKAVLHFPSKAIVFLQDSAGPAAAAAAVVVLLVLLTYASFELSTAIFRKKEF